MFIPLPLLVVIAVVVAGALFLAFRPRRQRDDLMAPPSRAATPHSVYKALSVGTLSPDDDARARALVQAGEVIKAIVLVREVTGLGLAEAKAVVDEMR